MECTLTIVLRPGLARTAQCQQTETGSTGQILSWNPPSRTRLRRKSLLLGLPLSTSLPIGPLLESRVRVLPGRGTPHHHYEGHGQSGTPPWGGIARGTREGRGSPWRADPGEDPGFAGRLRWEGPGEGQGRGRARLGRQGCVRRV